MKQELGPKIAGAFGNIRIHVIPALRITGPDVFFGFEDARIIQGRGRDRSDVGKSAISAEKRSSTDRTERTMYGVSACCNGWVFFIASGNFERGRRYEENR
jgi:hypothetical protein